MKLPLTEDQGNLLEQEIDNYYISFIIAFRGSSITYPNLNITMPEYTNYRGHKDLSFYINSSRKIESLRSLRLEL